MKRCANCLLGAFLICLGTLSAWAQSSPNPLRIASFHTELSRKGPGLLVRDLERQKANPQIDAVIATLVEAQPDIVVLQGLDWDMSPRVFEALRARLAMAGLTGLEGFALRPNSGFPSGVDLDGDGQNNGPGDSFGWGHFSGQGGMMILSRLPIDGPRAADFSTLRWRDLPGHQMPRHPDGSPFPSSEGWDVWRLSSVGHWAVPIVLPNGRDLWMLAFHAAPRFSMAQRTAMAAAMQMKSACGAMFWTAQSPALSPVLLSLREAPIWTPCGATGAMRRSGISLRVQMCRTRSRVMRTVQTTPSLGSGPVKCALITSCPRYGSP